MSETATRSRIEAALGSYLAACQSLDVDHIVKCFSEEAVVEDPIDEPYVGKEAVAAYFTAIYAELSALQLDADPVFYCRDRAACSWRGVAVEKSGRLRNYQGIDTFEFDAAGTISRMTAYWRPEDLIG